MSAVEELDALYAEFDRRTAEVSPVCRASGRCCDFDAFGHTLFASRLEAEVLVERGGLRAFDPATRLCPFWKERKCTARAPRPLGCRAFFCDEAKTDAMRALHEEALGRLKGLHARHGIPWRYAPLLRHLEEILPAPG